MPLKSLVVVALRFSALYFAVEYLSELALAIPLIISMTLAAGIPFPWQHMPLGILGMLLLALIIWFNSSKLAALITGQNMD